MNEDDLQGAPVSLWSPVRLAYGLLPVLTVLQRHGVDADPLLYEAGIARFGLMDPTYTISIEQELGFLKAVLRALPRPALSLEVAREYRLRGFSVLGLAMQASADPLSMLRLVMRFPRLAWGMFDGLLLFDADRVRVRFDSQPRLGHAEGFLAERDLACILVVLEEATERRFPVEAVRFRHGCAVDPGAYEEFFGCPVVFGADRTEFVCRRHALEAPLPQADATICSFYAAQCDRMSRSMDQPFRYEEAVRSRLLSRSVVPDLEALAASMFLTARTLQRRLRAEGVAFSDVLREVRKQRACEMLEDGRRSMEQIAATLGFSDAVAFSHAFKGWLGLSPRQWQQATASQASGATGASAAR